jgi:UDP-N-acetylmuramoylalanine--D-glutamate ligase
MDKAGKSVVILGAARSGLAAAEFLAARGARVTLADQRTDAQLAKEAERMKAVGVATMFGAPDLDAFATADELVVSPGVPLTAEPVRRAMEAGVSVIGELELAARYLKGRVVGITGSNGKTTTTTLVGEMLREGGLPTQVGGNIGTAAVSLVETSREDGWTVLECSSFQLETTRDFRPQVGVLLNITPDHLDRHGTFENYVAAKLQMFRNHGVDTLAVLNADDPSTPLALEMLGERNAGVTLFSRTRSLDEGMFVANGEIVCRTRDGAKTLMPVSDIGLRGAHNVENVLAALCAALACGVAPDSACDTVRKFKSVEHRLEFVAEIGGVSFFNDSKATNVDAAIKAIEAFPGGLHVILGGKDKGSDYTPLVPLLNERAKSALLIGAATPLIEGAFEGRLSATVATARCATMADAVREGARRAVPGDTVLLAPACASFDMFDNFEHRGAVFKDEVLKRMKDEG